MKPTNTIEPSSRHGNGIYMYTAVRCAYRCRLPLSREKRRIVEKGSPACAQTPQTHHSRSVGEHLLRLAEMIGLPEEYVGVEETPTEDGTLNGM